MQLFEWIRVLSFVSYEQPYSFVVFDKYSLEIISLTVDESLIMASHKRWINAIKEWNRIELLLMLGPFVFGCVRTI